MTDVERFYTPGCTDKVVLARHYDGLAAELAICEANRKCSHEVFKEREARIAQLEAALRKIIYFHDTPIRAFDVAKAALGSSVETKSLGPPDTICPKCGHYIMNTSETE